MYKNFFGLNRNPFELSPDPSFLCPSERIEEALGSIYYAVSKRKGFIVLTGEVGTGKTLAVRHLCDMWKEGQIAFANIIGPRLSVIDFLNSVTFDLGIKVVEPTKGNLLRALYQFLLAQHEKGLTTVLVIDEAHQVRRSVLEEIRMLTNFETAQEKLLQVLLVGQPELDQKLDSFELRQLKQRISIRCKLEPLSEEETRCYIEGRLKLAGANSRASTIFAPDTVSTIYSYSSGIPRLVNSICDQALTAAYARQISVVPSEIIDEVASYFRLQPAVNLVRTENPSSLAEPRGASDPETSWPPEPAADALVNGSSDSNMGPSHAGPPSSLGVPTTWSTRPEASLTSIGSREQEGVPPVAKTITTPVITIDDEKPCPTTAISNSETQIAPEPLITPAVSALVAESRKAAPATRPEPAAPAGAMRSSTTRKNSRSIAASIALLFILVGVGTWFRPGARGNAGEKPAQKLAAPPMAPIGGENSTPQTEQSTLNGPMRDVKSESLHSSQRLPKPQPNLKKSRTAAKQSVPNFTFDLLGSLNARPISHPAEVQEIDTTPALNPGIVSGNDNSVLPAIAASPGLAELPPPDSKLPAPAESERK